MHWIQTIRGTLRISQKDLAIYLQLSVPTIKAVETGRRQLPNVSLEAAMTLYNALKACAADGLVSDATTLSTLQVRQLNRLNNRYQRRLEQATDKLEKMQKKNASARLGLNVYQELISALGATSRKGDVARRRWAELRITEATRRMKENSTTAQGLIKVEIAGLKAMKQTLERMLL